MNAPRGWARWDHSEDADILSGLWSTAELAARFGRSARAIYNRHHKLREDGKAESAPPRRPWTPEEDAQVQAAAGGTLIALAAALGRSYEGLRTRRSFLRGNRRRSAK